MCLAGIVPANESTRLTKSMVPVMMDGVRLPAYSQQMASSALSAFQAPLGGAGDELCVPANQSSFAVGSVLGKPTLWDVA